MKMNFKRNVWIVILLISALILRLGFELIIRVFRIDYSFTAFLLNAFRYSVTFIAILIWVRIVIKSEYTINKLPWLLFLTLEPFTGILFFLTFGRDFRESNRYKNRPLIAGKKYLTKEPKTDFNKPPYNAIDSEITDIYKTAYNMTGHHAYYNDSNITVLRNGVTYFPVLLEALEDAKDFILLQTYILRTDDLGKKVIKILTEKAKKGVEVYLLYDAIGSVFIKKKVINELVEAGGEVHIIDPIQTGFFDTRMTYRNHRKAIIIDGVKAFVGGMNIADEYFKKIKKYPRFRDTQLMIEGDVINSVTQLFFMDYYYVTGTFIDDTRYYPKKELHSNGLVQIIPSGPEYKYPSIRNVYVKMINNAKHSIKIMTPYIALDQELVTSLIIAARGGVDVEIITSGKPDRKWVSYVSESFYEELLKEGIKIYQYKDHFTHGKVIIMDDRLASCGTYNLDNRSARMNFEVTVLLYKQGVDSLVKDFTLDRSKSELIETDKWLQRGYLQRVIEGVMNILSPLV